MSTLGKGKFPQPPQTTDYVEQKRRFEFISHTVDTNDPTTAAIELDVDANFIGIVQLKDSPVFRAVFFKSATPFDKANAEYDKQLGELIAQAKADGVEVQSLSELEEWFNGDSEEATPLDFTKIREQIEAAKEQQ